MCLCDDRAGKGSTKHICAFINRVRLESREDVISYKRLPQILDIDLACASCISFLFNCLEILVLSDVCNICDYIETFVCEPLEDNRSIQTARICKNDFFLCHVVFSLMALLCIFIESNQWFFCIFIQKIAKILYFLHIGVKTKENKNSPVALPTGD